MLNEIMMEAMSMAPEMSALVVRAHSAEQQLQDLKHIAHCACVAKDVAEAGASAARLQLQALRV